MSNVTPIIIQRENVADDTVAVKRWLKTSGDRIKVGDELFEIETSKALMSVEADQEGYLEILAVAGQEVAVGGKVALLHPTPFDTEGQETHGEGNRVEDKDGAGPLPLNDRPRFSSKASSLIQRNGLNPAIFDGYAFVREDDVIKQLETEDESTTDQVNMPENKTTGFLSEIVRSAKRRNRNFPLFAMNYLFRNYLMNIVTPLAPVGLIILMHRLRGVKVGKGCFIDPSAQVETAYPENIIIGDDVRITAHCVIMSHIKAPNYLQDKGLVPFVLKKVILEDHCFIGVNSVIMPGVRVGKAAVVCSGSVVICDVPPYTTVAGNPAKVIKRFPHS